MQLGRGEPIADTARVLSRYVDGIMIRTFAHQEVEELARYADVPVINGLTDLVHPCQVLADLLTVKQHLGDYKGKRFAWIGDGNNMANSWLNAAYVLGFELDPRVSRGLRSGSDDLSSARAVEGEGAASCAIRRRRRPRPHVVNTDVWASMGQEEEQAIREKAFKGFTRRRVAHEARDGGRDLPALPARAPRRGSHRRRDRRTRRAACGTRPRTGCTSRRRSWRC